MIKKLKHEWRFFCEQPSGQRFQNQNKRGGEAARSGPRHFFGLCVGTGVTALGLVMMPAPGPGFPIVALGLSLLAYESKTMAELLDATELRLRPPVMHLIEWWRSRRSNKAHA